MFYKLSRAAQILGLTISAAGAFVAGLSLASGEIIKIESTQTMIIGILIGLLGLCWEIYLDLLNEEREEKRIRKTERK